MSNLTITLREHADTCDKTDRGWSARLLRRAAEEIERLERELAERQAETKQC